MRASAAGEEINAGDPFLGYKVHQGIEEARQCEPKVPVLREMIGAVIEHVREHPLKDATFLTTLGAVGVGTGKLVFGRR